MASAGTSTVTVLRTFLRFLQAAAVEVALAVEVVFVLVALTAVDAVLPVEASRHLQDFVIWDALTPGMAERVRGLGD